jgi:RimJ/RimL family protein N-acetyltransferase
MRVWRRDDVEARAAWPPYPPPYEPFTSGLARMSAQEKDSYFAERDEAADRVTLTVDHATQPVIGLVILCEINWQGGIAGNMGVRLHPDWCDKHIGTAMMRAVVRHFTTAGLSRLRLDVAALNTRAVRCYENAGFVPTGSFERDGGTFLWMEARKPLAEQAPN